MVYYFYMLSKLASLIVIFVLLFTAILENQTYPTSFNKTESISACAQKKCVAMESQTNVKSSVTHPARSARTLFLTHFLAQLIYKDSTPIESFEWFSNSNHFNSYKTSSYYQCRQFFHKF